MSISINRTQYVFEWVGCKIKKKKKSCLRFLNTFSNTNLKAFKILYCLKISTTRMLGFNLWKIVTLIACLRWFGIKYNFVAYFNCDVKIFNIKLLVVCVIKRSKTSRLWFCTCQIVRLRIYKLLFDRILITCRSFLWMPEVYGFRFQSISFRRNLF